MSYTPVYITIDDVKDKSVSDIVTRAQWSDDNIKDISIQEAETYVEGRLVRLGYTRTQLQTAPLVKSLCINYSKYCLLRDIFTQVAPSRSAGEEYEKWKVAVDSKFEEIEKNIVRLVDTNGNIIVPQSGDSRFKVTNTTEDVKRAITMDNSWTWTIDTETYANSDVVGEK